jgi:hypothetical protein
LKIVFENNDTNLNEEGKKQLERKYDINETSLAEIAEITNMPPSDDQYSIGSEEILDNNDNM